MPVVTRAFQRVVGAFNPETVLTSLVDEVNAHVAGLPLNALLDIQWSVASYQQNGTLIYTAFVITWEN